MSIADLISDFEREFPEGDWVLSSRARADDGSELYAPRAILWPTRDRSMVANCTGDTIEGAFLAAFNQIRGVKS